MRIFLTGATGFIGSHVLRLLLDRGEEVWALSRKGRDNVHLRDRDSPRLRIVTGDLLEMETYEKPLGECEAVIHIAGWNRRWGNNSRLGPYQLAENQA